MVSSQPASTSGTKVQLVGCNKFVRHNPKSDKFTVLKFGHIEFWCYDATNTYKRFQYGLGMPLVAKSDHSTGNAHYCSYALQSQEVVFAFTAPYSRKASKLTPDSKSPLPHYDQQQALDFISSHGLAVRAVGLIVDDAQHAYETSVANGAIGILRPLQLLDQASGTTQVISEVKLYGDVVLRYISGDFTGPFIANMEPVTSSQESYGLKRVDHAVGNTYNLVETVEYIMGFTGFHEFAEFVAEDVGTVDSGLNSMVLANNNEMIMMPINEPTYGTKRKSQIQTYLEQNEGPGLQHIALETTDIISTLRKMLACGDTGFQFVPHPGTDYYRQLPARIGDAITPAQYSACEELGILVDKDDQGVLLQIFTRPLGDRPTVFIEIIERVGCVRDVELGTGELVQQQVAGCGGFGKGNFGALFKSIEDYERTLKV